MSHALRRALRRHPPSYLMQLASHRITGMLTRRWRQLPDLVIIGAQRCGTTSLFNYLTQHPNFHPSYPKEVNYFTLYYARGADWYRSHFPLMRTRDRARRAGRAFVAGEATPYYIYHPRGPHRMADLIPDVRLILLLRCPVDRAYSHYHYEVKKGIETLSFEEAVAQEEDRLNGELARFQEDAAYWGFAHHHFSYLARGRYAEQVSALFEHFDREQVLILRSEDLYSHTIEVLKQVLAYGELPAHTFKELKRYNETHHAEMDAAMRERLEDYFRPHNEALYDLVQAKLW